MSNVKEEKVKSVGIKGGLKLKESGHATWQTWDELITVKMNRNEDGTGTFYFRLTGLFNGGEIIVSTSTWSTLHDLKEYLLRVPVYDMRETFSGNSLRVKYGLGQVDIVSA